MGVVKGSVVHTTLRVSILSHHAGKNVSPSGSAGRPQVWLHREGAQSL